LRLRREQWTRVDPDDVAWVVEWQLASAFPWLPLHPEGSVEAAKHPGPGSCWRVWIRTGLARIAVELPLRDIAHLVNWGQVAPTWPALLREPATVRASALSVRALLRKGLHSADPLARMGYSPEPPEPGIDIRHWEREDRNRSGMGRRAGGDEG
jgi:hypothetical protein